MGAARRDRGGDGLGHLPVTAVPGLPAVADLDHRGGVYAVGGGADRGPTVPAVAAAMRQASMALGVAAMVAAPAAWSASVLDTYYAGSALDASAGPGGGLMGMGHSGPAIGPHGLGLRESGGLSDPGMSGLGARHARRVCGR